MLKAIEFLPADLLGLTPLGRAVRAGGPVPEGLCTPQRLAELPPPRERLEPEEREHLARWLESRLTELAPHVAVIEGVRSLALPGAACVLTSARPGLLGGPLETLWRALQAIALARSAARAWERPVVPVLWNRADERELAGVEQAWILNRNLELQRLALTGLGGGRRPYSRVVLDAERQRLPAVRALLVQLYGDQPAIEEALELFLPRARESLARAFTRSMLGLCGHLGLVVVEPDWLRDEASQALARIAAGDPRPELEAGARSLSALGQPAPADPLGAELVLRLDAGGAHPLRAGGEGYRYDGEPGSRTGSELAAEIVQEPSAWCPGPLWTHLVQDAVLPLAARLGDEPELADEARLQPLRRRLGLPSPPFALRTRFTLVDADCERSLARLGRTPQDVLRDGGLDLALDWNGALDPGGTPEGKAGEPAVTAELRALAARSHAELLAHRVELARIEPALSLHLKRAADQLRGAIDKLCHKAERAQANRSGRGRRHARRVKGTLFPNGEPQECVSCALPFVARHGRRWIDELAAELDPFCGEHVVVRLRDDAGD